MVIVGLGNRQIANDKVLLLNRSKGVPLCCGDGEVPASVRTVSSGLREPFSEKLPEKFSGVVRR